MSIDFNYDTSYTGPAFPVVQIDIISGTGQRAESHTAYIDSGADATLIPLHILDAIDAEQVDSRFARTVSGSRYQVDLYEVILKIGPYTVYGIDAIANENTSELILGRDALNQLVVKLDGIAQVTEVHN